MFHIAAGSSSSSAPTSTSTSASASSSNSSAISSRTWLQRLRLSISRRFQMYLDRLVPFVLPRWLVAVFLLLVFMLRVYVAQGWFIVAYGLGIYMLNLFILFLSPQVDPDAEFDDENDDERPALPTSRFEDGEFRPFVRKLLEFKFWYSITKAILISLALTLTRLTDIPVFWPILLLYFIVLFIATMKRQIQHMIRHHYLPFTRGKHVYKEKNAK